MKKQITKRKVFWLCLCIMICCLVVIQPDFFMAKDTVDTGAAAMNTVTAKFDNFYNIIATFISGIGTIVALWCVAEIGGSWMGHGNGTAQFEAFKRMGGAILWIAAPQLIALF